MKHGAFDMIPKADARFALETAHILMTQKSSHVETTNEDNDHQFFRYQGYCSL
jgi:hypothetical protein